MFKNHFLSHHIEKSYKFICHAALHKKLCNLTQPKWINNKTSFTPHKLNNPRTLPVMSLITPLPPSKPSRTIPPCSERSLIVLHFPFLSLPLLRALLLPFCNRS